MAAKTSAGILLYRVIDGAVEVLIGHMGGPFWARKDNAGWSIPKGEHDSDEEPFEVARREFREEIGIDVPATEFIELGWHKQSSGKVIMIWAAKGDLDPSAAVSNTFELEWPKGSGRIQSFPEIDRVAWVDLATARQKLVKGQLYFIDELEKRLAAAPVAFPISGRIGPFRHK